MGRLLVLLVLISSVFGQYDDMPTLCDEFSPDMCPDGQTCDTEEGECVVAVPPGNGGNPPEGNSNPGGVVVGGDLNDPCTPGDANACRTDVPSPGLVCDAVRKKCVFAVDPADPYTTSSTKAAVTQAPSISTPPSKVTAKRSASTRAPNRGPSAGAPSNRRLPPPLGDCEDLSAPGRVSDCPQRKYLCNNPQYYELMTIQCPQTCGRCRGWNSNRSSSGGDGVGGNRGSRNRDCKDLHAPGRASDCPRRKYLCNNPQYYDLMTIQCPQTCGRC
ncbi:hypothetical protein QR680_004499 [Steinernema hermaphroditum]|uniref:ShKT domain-containing protein n=1 Tax=Steinernema hermaphroditum TaxID=289476 RepID=A0AA39HNW8_9BILA|nr:hypothetical protein QR680_004499 [Steinernema hermaphroditum]